MAPVLRFVARATQWRWSDAPVTGKLSGGGIHGSAAGKFGQAGIFRK